VQSPSAVLPVTTLPAPICGRPRGLATLHASALVGLDAYPIRVEVCATRGPAFFQMVGLAEAAVREARVRVASALARLGVLLDEHAITVNLAPADLRKSGAALDLAIAVGVLGAVGELDPLVCQDTLLLGELSLEGRLQAIRGVLPQLDGARARGLAGAVVPAGNAAEAGLVTGLPVFVATDLEGVCAHLAGRQELPRAPRTPFSPTEGGAGLDLAEIRGQGSARRALEVAAAGNHNLLMVGPPGGGKTLLARVIPTILPALTFAEALEATAIQSVAGLVDPERGVVTTRPFRAPHHSVSDAGLVGGGDVPRPGEVSLAHHGVLFLDELAEFRRSALEALRQPLEDGRVCISRARARAWFPARPLVVAAVNPCPCGYWGHPLRRCRCSPVQRRRYLARLSGPLLDRIDVHVSVPPVDVRSLATAAAGESSAAVRARVLAARERQRERQRRGEVVHATNAALSLAELDRVAALDREGRALIDRAVRQLGLSARAYVRVLRVARSVADLEATQTVRAPHVAEAVQGRLLEAEGLG